MKYILTIFLFAAFLFTGCLDANNDLGCVPVDQSAALAEYDDKEGYEKKDSGLIYKVLEEGDVEVPTDERYVFISLEGKLLSGDVIEETENLIFVDRFNVNLPGIREGLALMAEGATYEFVMPPELAFGNNPPQGSIIQCGAVVIYEITLDSFLRDVETYLEQNKKREDVKETDSGLQYRVIEESEGDSPELSDGVRVRYKGSLTNGFIFDQTTGDNTTTFGVNGVIPGFTEGLLLMTEGSKYEFFIPPSLAYGDNPPRDVNENLVVPPNAILMFEVELVEIIKP